MRHNSRWLYNKSGENKSGGVWDFEAAVLWSYCNFGSESVQWKGRKLKDGK